MKFYHQLTILQIIVAALNSQLIQAEMELFESAEEENGRSRSLGGATCLYQADFDYGTFFITEPGNYKLCEDISFYPQVSPPEEVGAAGAFEPDEIYDVNAFGLGFFAALVISASDVNLDLNGFTIEQSAEHALLQRFFAVIELADSPFIPGVGPAQFVGESSTFNPASNIVIQGPGTIGRSAHHGIHGNENSNIMIKKVTFKNFEVAAVSLNNVDGLEIVQNIIPKNRNDVPVLGMFSAAKFIGPYGKLLKDQDYTMTLRGVETTAAEVYDALCDSMDIVFNDVMQNGMISESHTDEYELFHNPHQVVDGPCYAFLVNGKGPAVGDFKFELPDDDTLTSSNIKISDNEIRNIKCWTNEVPAIVEDGSVVNDPRGAVFQLIRASDNAPIAINSDGTYKGNVVADMQIMVAKAIDESVLVDTPQLQTLVNTINPTIINWASSGTEVYDPQYRCNGDSMHHVSKGMSIIRVDNAVGFDISRNLIKRIFNFSPAPFSNCNDYHTGANIDNAEDITTIQQGANIRGISAAAVSGVSDNSLARIWNNQIGNFNSIEATAIVGIDIQGKSEGINIKGNTVNLKDGVGEDPTDQFIALRLRDYVDPEENQIQIKTNNLFLQEVETMETHPAEIEGCKPKNNGGNGAPFKSEWDLGESPGGCPFGFKPKKKQSIFD